MTKSRYSFGDLDLIFNVTLKKKPNLGQKLIKMRIIFRADQRILTEIWMKLISGHDKR